MSGCYDPYYNPYNSGCATYYLTVSVNSQANMTIKNIGLNTVSYVSGNINILQITNN